MDEKTDHVFLFQSSRFGAKYLFLLLWQIFPERTNDDTHILKGQVQCTITTHGSVTYFAHSSSVRSLSRTAYSVALPNSDKAENSWAASECGRPVS